MKSADPYITTFLLRRWTALKTSLPPKKRHLVLTGSCKTFFFNMKHMPVSTHTVCNPYSCNGVSYLVHLTISQKHFGSHTFLQEETFRKAGTRTEPLPTSKSISNVCSWVTLVNESSPTELWWTSYCKHAFLGPSIWCLFLLMLFVFSWPEVLC